LLLQLFAANILPILVVAAVGFFVRRILHLDTRTLARVAFYICLPALFFQLLLESDAPTGDMLRLVGLAASLVAALAVITLVLARRLHLPPTLASAFIISVTFMNAGNFGLSLTTFALGNSGLALAGIFFVTSTILSNVLAIYVAAAGRVSRWQALRVMFRIPALYAIPLALVFRATGATLPLPLARPVGLLAQAAIPLMLLLLGMQLAEVPRLPRPGLLAMAAGLRLVASPLLAWLIAPWLGLSGLALHVGILQAATPAAVAGTLVALEFDAEPDFVAAAVLCSTLASPLTITPLLAVLPI
jgi:hypothetical protein